MFIKRKHEAFKFFCMNRRRLHYRIVARLLHSNPNLINCPLNMLEANSNEGLGITK